VAAGNSCQGIVQSRPKSSENSLMVANRETRHQHTSWYTGLRLQVELSGYSLHHGSINRKQQVCIPLNSTNL